MAYGMCLSIQNLWLVVSFLLTGFVQRWYAIDGVMVYFFVSAAVSLCFGVCLALIDHADANGMLTRDGGTIKARMNIESMHTTLRFQAVE